LTTWLICSILTNTTPLSATAWAINSQSILPFFIASIDEPKPDLGGEEFAAMTDAEAGAEYDRQEKEIEAWKARIDAEIDACEQRHAEAGTLDDQIG
jgi:hypothetical protein